MNDEQHLAGLNTEQKEAALHMEGPLLIVAGAGAGKTKTITHRIVNLIKNGVSPDKILAVTFTNKAAKEMRERINLAIKDSFVGNAFSEVLGKNPQTVRKSIPDSVPFVSTFHSLGVYIIKENARLLGLTRYFTILDDGDTTTIIKNILKDIGIDPKMYDPRKIKNIISREKGKFTHLADYEEREGNGASSLGKIVSQVWNLYEKQKTKENSLDFDDLLLKATKLLKENEEIRKIYQEKWEYIHVDEYQDTNEVQYLMSKLLSENNKNICVVGDADQNIYSWRGANLKNILSFEKDYPNAKIVLLEQNYRSTKNILEAANEIIKKNKYRPDKNLFTDNVVGEKIGLYEALDETDEAEFVATKILEIIDGAGNTFSNGDVAEQDILRGFASSDFLSLRTAKQNSSLQKTEEGSALNENERSFSNGDVAEQDTLRKASFGEVAVLYRANFQSRALEEAMLRYNIPYQVLGVKFFERKEIKDTLAYLRAALNPESLSDIKRIINFPTRGIGKATLVKIFAGEKEKLPIKTLLKVENFYDLLSQIKEKIENSKTSEIIKFVVKKSGIEQELSSGTEEDMERLENIKELATLALKYDEIPYPAGVEKLLEDASLASDQDSLIERGEKKEAINAVKLMTVHASKGLEFKYVFVTGLEDGLFPHQRQNERQSGEDSEEERRLFYVALTRAKEKLFLSFANFRTIFGSRNINAPSEFISDIPADLLEKEGEASGIKTIYL
ncbi:MAG: UvrD-helicase domain-containing protein [Candidatus Paceibacterota bacterium]|jgi:DNA helicase-2/ATP-dependent DNA helicase PcrA